MDSLTPAVKQRLDNTLSLLTDVVVKSQQVRRGMVACRRLAAIAVPHPPSRAAPLSLCRLILSV